MELRKKYLVIMALGSPGDAVLAVKMKLVESSTLKST
jgi:hypothetical protein